MVDIKGVAKRVIREEAACVAALEELIDDDFVKVVEMIFESSGRVIVSGVGKSAIIGQKLVATLNSTGTRAVFMHAADAIHGDLGMICPDDVVICMSRSGNTQEIKSLIPLIHNVGNDRIVAIVGNRDSFLAKNSQYILNAYVKREADPNDLAPTSSTTAQLVLCDALAIALIECRHFSSNDFAKYHPGGSLGKRLYTRVSDIYDKDNRPKVSPDEILRKVIIEISEGRLGAVAVTDESEKLLGIITDGDLRRMLERCMDVEHLTAREIMTATPKCISADELAYNAFRLMEENNITQLVVTDDEKHYCGMIHLHDILKEGIV